MLKEGKLGGVDETEIISKAIQEVKSDNSSKSIEKSLVDADESMTLNDEERKLLKKADMT